jgi:hypothetical protein
VTEVTPKKGAKRTLDWQSAFLHHLSAQGNVSCASKAARISRKTVYARRDTDPLFKAAWDDALNEGCDHLEEEARRRAVEGTKKPIFYRGQVVGQIREYSDVLLIFLLKAHRPGKYREPTRNENWNIDPRDWSDAQIEVYRAGVPLAQVLAMARSVRNEVTA